MLTEICQYLRNWFDRARHYGHFVIRDGQLQTVYDSGAAFSSVSLAEGQYFRVVGSALNDGVHQFGEGLADEEFDGAVWEMCVPAAVLRLADDIEAWVCKYGGVDSQLLSPYTSESFGGYSYTKSSGVSSGGGYTVSGWESVFYARLSPWRKI